MKTTADFYVKDAKTGRLHAQCKACSRERRALTYQEHYRKYKLQYQDRARLRRDKLKKSYRDYMIRYLADKCCIECNENDIRVLEFDHVDIKTKQFSISQGIKLGYSLVEIETEIKKCQILCANCHKKRTSNQFGWYKEI